MRLACLALGLALLIGSAASAADPAPDFSAYRTYGWAPRKATAERPPVLDQVKAAIDKQMAEHGYALAAAPDLTVVFTVSARDRQAAVGGDVHVVPTPRGPMIVGKAQTQRTLSEGVLTIQMFDAKTRRPVFRATATEALSPRGADAKVVNRAVRDALAGLPARR